MVRSDWQGHGLGYKLMQILIAYADHRGIGAVYGDILAQNATMLQMARELGFTIETSESPGIYRVERSRPALA
jgi:acetyltransferase